MSQMIIILKGPIATSNMHGSLCDITMVARVHSACWTCGVNCWYPGPHPPTLYYLSPGGPKWEASSRPNAVALAVLSLCCSCLTTLSHCCSDQMLRSIQVSIERRINFHSLQSPFCYCEPWQWWDTQGLIQSSRDDGAGWCCNPTLHMILELTSMQLGSGVV